jgi:hypothetical protein
LIHGYHAAVSYMDAQLDYISIYVFWIKILELKVYIYV